MFSISISPDKNQMYQNELAGFCLSSWCTVYFNWNEYIFKFSHYKVLFAVIYQQQKKNHVKKPIVKE